ncbi:glycoside hydrolase family 2 TIM barrel-domain containing protein [Leifsonia sp. L25]|uniref:glycoside hydrolase family 2 TIM barrel-domain containing protein n=1 Tax=Leifsonia sp. L25 TaxID=3423957 RepID=UPI003D69A2C6
MLVVDEAFDMWTKGKNPFDYSLAFPEWWERDIEAMVAKDINRPSVVMYSIGNEVLDAGNALGARWGRRLAEKVRALDPTRFVTNGISGFVATISDILPEFRAQAGELSTQVGVNDLMSQLGDLMDQISSPTSSPTRPRSRTPSSTSSATTTLTNGISPTRSGSPTGC